MAQQQQAHAHAPATQAYNSVGFQPNAANAPAMGRQLGGGGGGPAMPAQALRSALQPMQAAAPAPQPPQPQQQQQPMAFRAAPAAPAPFAAAPAPPPPPPPPPPAAALQPVSPEMQFVLDQLAGTIESLKGALRCVALRARACLPASARARRGPLTSAFQSPASPQPSPPTRWRTASWPRPRRCST
jgi:hypothetical protein